MTLTENKGFQFPVPDLPNYFRIKNEHNDHYNLPTAALDAAIAKRDEINNDLQGNGCDEAKEYWSDGEYIMRTCTYDNVPGNSYQRTLKFIKRDGCLLLVAYTAKTFEKILNEYKRKYIKTEVTEPTMPLSL